MTGAVTLELSHCHSVRQAARALREQSFLPNKLSRMILRGYLSSVFFFLCIERSSYTQYRPEG